MLEFEHNPFARRKLTQGANDALPQFTASEAMLRAGAGSVIRHPVEHVLLLTFRRRRRTQISAPGMFLAQVIQTQIRNDAVNPGIERALESEAREIDVRTQKRFLVNVLPVFLRTRKVDGKPQ